MDSSSNVAPSSPIVSARTCQKRSYASSSSSDVPYFSSDDLADASVSAYSPERRKRQHRRHWWQNEDAADPKAIEEAARASRRRFVRRPKDSGIYMSSESSGGEDGFSVEHIKFSQPSQISKALPLFSKEVPKEPSMAEKFVERMAEVCMENGSDVVDIGGCDLESVPSRLLRPLRNLIRPPRLDGHHMDERYYHCLAPDLKVIISSNRLTEVPHEIFNLSNLTMLSFRNNRIQEIPTAIDRLSRLAELNCTGNQLRYLPWEMLKLIGPGGPLRMLKLSPNPLLQPYDVGIDFPVEIFDFRDGTRTLRRQDHGPGITKCVEELLKNEGDTVKIIEVSESIAEEVERRKSTSYFERSLSAEPGADNRLLVYLGSSPIALLGFDGSALKGFPQAPSALPFDQRILRVTSPREQARSLTNAAIANSPTSTSKVPSLFEAALRACKVAAANDSLLEMLPSDAPASVVKGTRLAEALAKRGGNKCSVCECSYVFPRAEWIEYYHILPDSLSCGPADLATPFLRRTCSWACAFEVQAARASSSSSSAS